MDVQGRAPEHQNTLINLGRHVLSVEVRGIGTPEFVCLHDIGDTGRTWHAIAPLLATRGRVILVDQRAHGGSSAPDGPCEFADLVSDVKGILDRLDIPRAILIGHGMGGTVALASAIASPERIAGLILLATASECTEQAAAWYEQMARAAETGGEPGLRRALFGTASTRSFQGDPHGLAAVARALKSLYRRPLPLARVHCPTFVLVGSRDFMGPGASTAIRTSLPRAVLDVVNCGHWIQIEAPDVIIGAVDRLSSACGRSRVSER